MFGPRMSSEELEASNDSSKNKSSRGQVTSQQVKLWSVSAL